MRTFIVAFILSLLSSLILTRLFRDWAIRYNWVDQTGGRKIHTQPIPRVGGFAILLSTIFPLLTLALWDNDISKELWGDKELIFGLAGGLSVIAIVGLVDDIKGVRARIKLLGQILAAFVAYQAGIHIDVLSIPFFHLADLGWLSMPVTIFWFVLSINAVNLIDGMDGLAASAVILGGGTLFFMCLVEEQAVASLILISMLGGVFGFLRYNLNPASIFLGDTGSMSLGFLLATVSVHFSQKSSAVFSLVASLLILGLPIFDLSMAIFRRFLSGKKIFSADQYHVHHILLRKGYTQKQSVVLLIGFAIAFEGLALLHIYAGDRLDAIVLLFLVIFLTIVVRLLGYHKIIFSQRKNVVMQKVQSDTDKELKAVLSFQKEIETAIEREEFAEQLTKLAKELAWEVVAIKKEHDIFRFQKNKTKKVHLDGNHSLEIAIGSSGYRLEVEWLEENSSMLSFDQAMIYLIAAMLEPFLSLFEEEQYQEQQ